MGTYQHHRHGPFPSVGPILRVFRIVWAIPVDDDGLTATGNEVFIGVRMVAVLL